MIRNLGVHVTESSIQHLRRYTNLFQVSLHDGKRFEFSYSKIQSSVANWIHLCPDAFFIVHCPYITNIMIDNKVLKSSVSCIKGHLRACLSLGSSYLVVHPGTRNSKDLGEVSLNDSVTHIKQVLRSIMSEFRGSSVKLLLENMSNTNLKGFPMDTMLDIVDELSPEVGLCFDIEHAWGRGEDLDRFEEFMGKSDVIHFNSIPFGVSFGGGIDRHSLTTIDESVGISPLQLKKWLVKFKDKIKIMEVDFLTADKALSALSEENKSGKLKEMVHG